MLASKVASLWVADIHMWFSVLQRTDLVASHVSTQEACDRLHAHVLC